VACAVGGFAVGAVPQVQQSGWPGFVPTTVEIVMLPWLERPSAERQTVWRQRPGSLRMLEQLFLDLRRHRVDANRLWKWQRWLLYERVLWGDPEAEGARQRFVEQYEGYLQLIGTGSELSKRQHDKLLDWAAPWPLRVRERWPADTAVPVELHAYGYFEDAVVGRVLRARPVGVPGEAWETPMMGPMWWRDATNGGAWKRHSSNIGPVGTTKKIEFDLELVDFEHAAWEAGDRTGKVSWKKRVSVAIDARGTIDDVMEGVESEELFRGMRVTFKEAAEKMAAGSGLERLRSDETFTRMQSDHLRLRKYQQGQDVRTDVETFLQRKGILLLPSGTLDLGEVGWLLSVRIVKLDMVVCGLRFDVVRDGRVVAEWRGWGVGAPRTGGSNYGEGELVHGYFKPVDAKWLDEKPGIGDARSSSWKLRIVGDPKVAIGYWNSNRYWKGEVEIPIEVQEDGGPPR
jgi:hypothetical protein